MKRQALQTSKPAIRSQVDYFSDLQMSDITVNNSFVENVTPYYSLSDSANLVEFHLHTNPTTFIDLKSSTIYVQLKVLKADGSKLDASDKVSTCNNLLHSLFRSCEIVINGTVLMDPSENYALKSYILCHLGIGTERKKTELTSALYYEDDDGVLAIDTDKGQKKRAEFIALSKTVELEGKLKLYIAYVHDSLINIL
jgi:hypothetical protein